MEYLDTLKRITETFVSTIPAFNFIYKNIIVLGYCQVYDEILFCDFFKHNAFHVTG